MAGKKQKKRGTASETEPVVDGKMTQPEIRKRLFIRAIQSKPVTVLVGPSKKAFYVPEDLLIRYSPAFEKMLHRSFKESVDRSVELPEDSILVYEDFLIWIYGQMPCISADAELNSLVSLAVFADHYFVYLLQNQISDVMRTKLSDNTWKLNPETMRAVYEETPAGSTLRQLCSLAFTVNSRQTDSWGDSMPHDDWKPVFTEFADFGWDYFQHNLELRATPTVKPSFGVTIPAKPVPLLEGGACRFHNHSDIPGWERTNVSECPYPQGGPFELPKDEETPELKSPSTAPAKDSLSVSTGRNELWLQRKEQFDAEAEETSKMVNLDKASEAEETSLAPMDNSLVVEALDNLDDIDTVS